MNGKAIIVDGKIGAVHRHEKNGDIRGNISYRQKGHHKAVITEMLELVEVGVYRSWMISFNRLLMRSNVKYTIRKPIKRISKTLR